MSRQPGGNGGEIARGAGSAAIKGALLIGLAIIVGVFLLQRVDSGKATTSTTTKSTKPKVTTTTKPPEATSSTTAAPTTPVKTPDQLKVIVLNGGAPSGQAAVMRTKLVQAGYTNEPQANNAGYSQQGNTVQCKAGLEREAVALSQQTALQGSKVEPFPATPPANAPADVDCIVVVGQ